MRRIRGIALAGAGLCCIVAALTMTMRSHNQEQLAQQAVTQAMPRLEQHLSETARDEQAAPSEMRVLELDGAGYLGVLSIPAVGIEVPILHELTDQALDLGPCRYTGSYLDQSMIVGGHNYAGHFAQLRLAEVGDLVRFQSVDGHVLSYQVAALQTLGGSDVAEMLDPDWDLTLFTCTYSGTERVTVRCKAISDI